MSSHRRAARKRRARAARPVATEVTSIGGPCGTAARALPFAMGELRTRRWNDPAEPGDGLRILVCRYRPRGVARARETWDAWWKELGPSPALHAAAYGKRGPAIDFAEYTPSAWHLGVNRADLRHFSAKTTKHPALQRASPPRAR